MCIRRSVAGPIQWQCVHARYWYTIVLWLTLVDQSVVGCGALADGAAALARGGGPAQRPPALHNEGSDAQPALIGRQGLTTIP